jgi:AcrR family transcriptional regulator
MPRTKEVNEQIRAEQRENILAAALRIFARKGLAATMDDVAREAGISHGLAYRYFSSKEALVHMLVERATQPDPIGLTTILETPGTPGERLALLVESLLTSRREQPAFYQLINHLMDQVRENEQVPEKLRADFLRQSQTFFRVIKQLIVEGQATGELRGGDPDQLVTALAACLEGLSRLAAHEPEQFKQSCPDAEILLRLFKQ